MFPCARDVHLAAPGTGTRGPCSDAHEASPLFLSCSQSYLQAASDGPASHGLDPSANYNSPKFRSRNQSYMRAVSTLSQASCVSQVGPPLPVSPCCTVPAGTAPGPPHSGAPWA